MHNSQFSTVNDQFSIDSTLPFHSGPSPQCQRSACTATNVINTTEIGMSKACVKAQTGRTPTNKSAIKRKTKANITKPPIKGSRVKPKTISGTTKTIQWKNVEKSKKGALSPCPARIFFPKPFCISDHRLYMRQPINPPPSTSLRLKPKIFVDRAK